MTIKDEVLGDLEYEYGWRRDYNLNIFKKDYKVNLFVENYDENLPEQEQKNTYIFR